MRLQRLTSATIFLALTATLAAQTPTPTPTPRPKRPVADIFRPGLSPVHIVSDSNWTDGPKSQYWGDVRVTVGDVTVVADEANTDLRTGEINLKGDVRLVLK